MILILGSEGSMGKRYQAILRHLGKEFVCIDKDDSSERYNLEARRASAFIIATPTPTHFAFISDLISMKKPILCEKPVTTSMPELEAIGSAAWDHHTPFRMMLQYSMQAHPKSKGDTSYDYFRTGNDGTVWDCLQIIGLAKGKVEIKNQSPVWKCELNGQKLNLSDMDQAYVDYVETWLMKPHQNFSEIRDMHYKTREMESEWLSTQTSS